MKLAKMMNLKNLTMALLLLSVAGCGCNDDSFPPGSTALIITSVLGMSTDAPGVAVQPPLAQRRTIPIDVFFVLDDGAFMVRETLGNVPSNPTDNRTRSYAAQRIYNNLRANILAAVQARINAARLADPNSVPADIDVDDFDFAFGIGRYEDFGGPFNRRAGDGVARPFILQMPLLRDSNPGFAAAFDAALAQETPGNGAPLVNAQELFEANTGIEALFQIATGNGFDGNGNGNTTDSGAPALPATQQTPGDSGDVPGVQYVANGNDADGEPIFFLADEGGNPTTIPTSGNVGGVGFRPDSARFVILTSDSGTVAPTLNAPPPCPRRSNVSPTTVPPVANLVNSTAGAPDSPRFADGLDICGFNSSNKDAQQPFPTNPASAQPTEFYRSRFGLPAADKMGDNTNPDFAGVAPLGAATVRDTISQLNRLNIEVLTLGATQLGIAGGPTKPFGGSTAVNGDPAASVDEIIKFARVEGLPWSWLTMVSRLTGAADAGPARFPSGDPKGNPNGGLPLVYNLGDVWLFDKDADPALGNEAPVFLTPQVIDDLADRIFHEHVQKRFLRPKSETVPGTKVALPSVFYDFTLEIFPPQNSSLTRVDNLGNIIPVSNVQIPVWYSDEAPGSPVTVNFPTLEFNTINDMIPVPAAEGYRVKISAVLNRIEQNASNADQASQIRDFLEARGDGLGNPLTNLETMPVCHSDATVTVIVREVNDPGARALLSAIDVGCITLTDLTPVGGNPMTGQPGGTCPYPAPPAMLPPPPGSFEFICPGTIDAAATQMAGAIVTYGSPIPENNANTVTCVPASGSVFPIDTTTVVTCEERDAMNMVVHTCTFNVTVADLQPPAITCSLAILFEGGISGQSDATDLIANENILAVDQVTSDLTYDASADYPDNTNGFNDGPIDVTVPQAFPNGITTVTVTATDAKGLTSEVCTFQVIVIGGA